LFYPVFDSDLHILDDVLQNQNIGLREKMGLFAKAIIYLILNYILIACLAISIIISIIFNLFTSLL